MCAFSSVEVQQEFGVPQTADSGPYPPPYLQSHLVNQMKDSLSCDVFAGTLCEDVLPWGGWQQMFLLNGRVMTMRGCLDRAEGGGKNVEVQDVILIAVRVLHKNDQRVCSRASEVVKLLILWTVRY